jgi:predicted negative regulator of RcsB-dependent stress response
MSHGAPITATPALPAWEQFLENNFKKLLILFIAVVIFLGVYGAARYLGHRSEVKAGEAFASAKTVEDLDVVIQSHKGSAAAGSALLQKADLLWEQNSKSSAIDALREFVKNHGDHPLLAQALLGLGSKLEALGQRGDAKPIFERLVNEFGKTDLAALAELRLGDLAWAEGKEDEAKKIYEGIPAKFAGASADNAFIPQSESRLEWIAAKLPTTEVDGPPKPKVEAPAPGAPAIPGMPQFKLNSPSGALSPTVTPGGTSPVINLTPGGTSAPVTVTPGATMPAPAAPAPTAAPTTPAPKPAPAAPAAPSIEVKPVPAPAAPAPAAPAIEIKPAPATPATAPAVPAAPAKPAEQ